MKIKIGAFLVITFLSTGCTHTMNLEKRLDYSVEKEAKRLGFDLNNLAVKGADQNKEITLTRKTDGFAGGAHSFTFDIGSTFNELLSQTSYFSGLSCENSCQTVEVELQNPDLSYMWSHFTSSGFEYASFSSTINVSYPTYCAPAASFSKKYSFTKKLNSNEVGPSREFSPLISAMEAVIFELTKDINKSYSANCS